MGTGFWISICLPLTFLMGSCTTFGASMGRNFTSKTTRLFLCLIVVDLVVISAMVFPVVPVYSKTVMFEINNQPLDAHEIDYQWFDLAPGDSVRIEVLCDEDIDAYLFNEDQFVEYADGLSVSHIDKIGFKESGLLTGMALTEGTYFFVVSNPNDDPVQVLYTKGIGTVSERITLAQIIRNRFGTTIRYEPEIVRSKPGVGSNALLTPLLIGMKMKYPDTFLMEY